MDMSLTSPHFAQAGDIPSECTCDGANLSPAFAWSVVPKGTQSLLLVCDDPDAPGGIFHHWALYGVPPDWSGLPLGFASRSAVKGVQQAINDFGRPGYGGPCPPPGDRPHAYHFRLSALGGHIEAGPSARCVEIRRRAGPLEIAAAELVGYYGRR